jgi:AcrR family transcriptional regulator
MCKYEENVKPNLEQIKYWRGQGFKIDQIALKLGISPRSFAYYIKNKSELSEVMNESKDKLIANIAINGLYKRALGYSYQEKKMVKERIVDSEGKDTGYEKIKTEITEKQVAPDTTACIFSLKNLDPENWKDRQEVKHAMPQDNFEDLIKAFENIAATAKPERGDNDEV